MDRLKLECYSSCLKPLDLRANQLPTFRKITYILTHLQNLLPNCFIILSGGYVCYLEGLMKSYDNIDIFFVSQYLDQITRRNSIWSMLSSFPYDKKEHLHYISSEVGFGWDIKRLAICTTSDHGCTATLLINFFYVEVEDTPTNWFDAYREITIDIPLCNVALFQDHAHIFRITQASLTPWRNRGRYGTSLNSKIDNYRKGIKHFGEPVSLSMLCMQKLQWI